MKLTRKTAALLALLLVGAACASACGDAQSGQTDVQTGSVTNTATKR